jgi:hypothetical protein
MESVARTALSRNGTTLDQQVLAAAACVAHTAPAVAYDRVQGGYEVGHNGVGVVQPGEDGNDIGAGVGVLLGQGGI